MPELPDVETFKRYIESTSLHKKITEVNVKNKKILENISKKILEDELKNNRFVDIYRHGKYIFIKTNNAGWLILHFGMTGDVKYYKNHEETPLHTRLLITFENGHHFAFDNQRLFGKIGLTKSKEQYIKDKNLGVDALDLDYNRFKNLLKNKKAMVKSTLMNQKLIAGIGNIYADEILFQSAIFPKVKTNMLSEKKLREIYENMQNILYVAINAKADPNKFPNNYIIPNRQKDGVCPKGSEKLKTVKVNGRTTYFCPVHQRKK